MAFPWGSVISAVGGLLGGDNGAKKIAGAQYYLAKRQAEKGIQIRVADALAAGINPVTAIAGAGAPNVQANIGSIPPLSSTQFVADALGDVADSWFNREAIAQEQEVERLRLEQAKEQLKYWRDRNDRRPPPPEKSFGFSIPHVVEETRQTLGAPQLRPQARPTLGSAGKMPVFLPDGQPASIPRRTGERLQMKPWDAMTAGDYSELVGEGRGEAEAVLAVDSIGDAQGVPLFSRPPKDSFLGKLFERRKSRPFNPWTGFED
ncbi:hypothetical protein [Roseovarius sp.]|uniref:hypothetical protein n=1 Tax=Roseovarius sp. TaxID=1486281 RepID=UPI003BA96BF2